MATATITSGLTVLTSCDTNAAPNLVWSGGTITTDATFLKQGVAALCSTFRTVGNNDCYCTLSAPTNLSATHLRLWFSYAVPGALNVKASGGIQLFMYDGTNTGYWNLSGSDAYDGGWTLLHIDTSRAFDSGTCNKNAVTRVGFRLNLVSAPRNAVNTWWDFLCHGPGYTVTGGTAGDPIKWSHVAAADAAGGYGVVRLINGVYFVNSGITFGGAAGNTYFDDANQVVMFINDPVASTLYKVQGPGATANTTTVKFTGMTVKTAGPVATLDVSSANLTAFELRDSTVALGGGATTLKSGQTVSGTVFQGCGTIEANGATLTKCTYANHTADAVKVDSVAEMALVTGGIFALGTGAGNAIQVTATTTDQAPYNLDGHTFTGYGADGAATAALENASGGNVYLSISGGGATPTRVNTTNTFIVTRFTVTVNNLASGSRVKVFKTSDGTVLYNDVETGGVCTFQTDFNGEVQVEARRASSAPYYQPWFTVATIGTGVTVKALQVLDT